MAGRHPEIGRPEAGWTALSPGETALSPPAVTAGAGRGPGDSSRLCGSLELRLYHPRWLDARRWTGRAGSRKTPSTTTEHAAEKVGVGDGSAASQSRSIRSPPATSSPKPDRSASC